MADLHQRHRHDQAPSGQIRVSGKSAAMGCLAALATGGPLLGMAGISFLASVTLLLIASPPLLLFSPALLGAAAALAATLAAFGAAAVMALTGLSAFRWASKELRVAGRTYGGGVAAERRKDLHGLMMMEDHQVPDRQVLKFEPIEER